MVQEDRIHYSVFMKDHDVSLFCAELWNWFSVNKRTLPWRDLKTKDIDQKAYLVLVSEIMLQQTQVSRVIILYKKFVQQFPHIKALSQASNKDILIAWRGLGYNNRALRLRDAAKTIIEKHHGKFPSDMEALWSLPGVGHYTAGAIRNFAFGNPTPCMDVNIRRILHRFFVGMENADGTWKKDDTYLLKIAGKLLEEATRLRKGNVGTVGTVRTVGDLKNSSPTLPTIHTIHSTPSEWHAALMDFGSLVCTKNNPKWDLFPENMRAICKAYGKKMQRIQKTEKREPGRMMAGRFVPNRIFRGKIIEVLRDADNGLQPDEVGSRAIADWTMGDHRTWLDELVQGLIRDGMIEKKKQKWLLKV